MIDRGNPLRLNLKSFENEGISHRAIPRVVAEMHKKTRAVGAVLVVRIAVQLDCVCVVTTAELIWGTWVELYTSSVNYLAIRVAAVANSRQNA